MLSTVIFYITTLILILGAFYSLSSFIQFCVFAEITWLVIYSIITINGLLFYEVIWFAAPFLVLSITAVEASIAWSLISLISFYPKNAN